MIENQNRKSEETFSPLAKGHRLTDGVTYDDPSRDWFVVRAATRQEKRAEGGLVEAGMAVYVPRLTRWRWVQRRRVLVQQSLWDGYLFAGLGSHHVLHDLQRIDGVHGVVRFSADAHPRPIAYSQIALVLRAELAGKFDRTTKVRPLPEPGAPLEIIGGKFQGFTATFVQLRSNERVEMLFHLFGRPSTLVLARDQVRGLGQDDDEV